MFRVLTLTLVLLAAGCGPAGPQRAEVSGIVTFNGQPVRQGAISFFPAPGVTGPEAGAEIKDGQFFIARRNGPVVGLNRVELRSFEKTGRRIQDPTAPQGTFTEEIANIFPPQYSSESTLTREVKPGRNVISFELP